MGIQNGFIFWSFEIAFYLFLEGYEFARPGLVLFIFPKIPISRFFQSSIIGMFGKNSNPEGVVAGQWACGCMQFGIPLVLLPIGFEKSLRIGEW